MFLMELGNKSYEYHYTWNAIEWISNGDRGTLQMPFTIIRDEL